jgi:hypothetical protein
LPFTVTDRSLTRASTRARARPLYGVASMVHTDLADAERSAADDQQRHCAAPTAAVGRRPPDDD